MESAGYALEQVAFAKLDAIYSKPGGILSGQPKCLLGNVRGPDFGLWKFRSQTKSDHASPCTNIEQTEMGGWKLEIRNQDVDELLGLGPGNQRPFVASKSVAAKLQ